MKIPVNADLLDGLVLALLNQQDNYGYAITQAMQAAIPVSESTLYPVLRRLKKAGLVITYDHPFQGRNRRYYQITDPGKERLTEVTAEWNHYKQQLDQIFKGGNQEYE
ncbi:MAG TPA: PadR family transcriptional regulator [Candidatus Limosilactobacillus faecipullorum]|nr:PadR family transcriptional regulator [Candidatus Limosilactobacillus faecipullorum]